MDLSLRETADGVFIPLRVTPKSAKNALTGTKNGLLLVSVRAAPADGEANAAVLATLAAALGCSKSSLTLVRGQKGREKIVAVAHLTLIQVQERLSIVG